MGVQGAVVSASSHLRLRLFLVVGRPSSEFLPDSVRSHSSWTPPIHSRDPKTDGIPFPPRAKQTYILQIHHETRNQPHGCPDCGIVALHSGLYQMASWSPRRALHSRHQNRKVCCMTISTENLTWCPKLSLSDVCPCVNRPMPRNIKLLLVLNRSSSV